MTTGRVLPLDRRPTSGFGFLLVLGLWGRADAGPGPERGPPHRLQVLAGSGQAGTAGLALGDPVVARVTDAEGRAVPGVLVTFVAAQGGGGFAPETGLTDRQGKRGPSGRSATSDVQAVIALSAITDFTSPDELRDDYNRAFQTWPDPDSPEMIEASPVTHVTPGDAPFFFVVGDQDELVLPAQSARMHQRLQDAGVSSSLLRVLNAGHDLQPVTGPIDPTSETITGRMTEFFDQHLR